LSTALLQKANIRLLKNYLRCHYGVENRLTMLIYTHKLRLLADFRLVLAASNTFFSSLIKTCWMESATV